jgi:hypothetical protein
MILFQRKLLHWSLLALFGIVNVYPQQISIPRVEEMPNLPQPYLMRDWSQVALGYDSMAYDLGSEGDYLPLTGLYSDTRNYPEHGSFHQQTYVGQSLTHNEAINSMMSIVGASLCDIDKSDQNGNNWVLMAEEFFNRSNSQNLYLNNVGAKTGGDWWYETIPNVLFYQLYSLYPEEGHFSEQFITVADRWLEAVAGMGGTSSPWTTPYMNYRSFNLETIEPNATGVPEPEASGALAWIFYQAYTQTRNEKYRIGAELCMEFFSEWEENPSYEIQYLYGAIMAARMNGELGTNYDLEKIMNWCFDIGPLRVWAHTTGWGITVGTWNGIDVSGLNGAISTPDNTTFGDYAFLMNSFQQAGILTPLVRYDDRYAKAMGKYLLNMSNSARLFYSKYLPAENQDGAEWSRENDPNSYIAYEALRRYKDDKSPFATGDAMAGGWAQTNLSLYSSAAVGYLGSILDTTNIEGILTFDLLKTDFFHSEAYPSYLIYNPYSSSQEIKFDVGTETVDIYDATTNSLIAEAVSGISPISLAADEAIVMILIPSGAEIMQQGNTMVCNNIIIDYIPESAVANPMRLKALSAKDSVLTTDIEGTLIYCTIDSQNPDDLRYKWTEDGTDIGSNQNSLSWLSPQQSGNYWIKCEITNSQDENIIDSVKIIVVDFINTLPEIDRITLNPSRVSTGDTASLKCFASDPDETGLSYAWSASEGSFVMNQDETTIWNAPSTTGEYKIICEVTDAHDAIVRDSIIVRVIDPSNYQKGNLVAHYPFNNNTDDFSGNDNHGAKNNVSYIKVRDGAYDFNGLNSFVEVPSSDELNCNDAITVTFWMKPTQMYDREAYPISHGLWHNRWKVSVTDGKIRWTLRTNDSGTIIVSDLDSETIIEKDKLYQVTATYDGEYSDLYINAGFEGFLYQKGIIENTDIAMTIGQTTPTAAGYNFKGALDEIRIYDYALSHEDIKAAYQQDLIDFIATKDQYQVHINVYPNPFQEELNIEYQLETSTDVRIEILDMLSSTVKIIYEGKQEPGYYNFSWDGRSESGSKVSKGLYVFAMITDQGVVSKKIIFN